MLSKQQELIAKIKFLEEENRNLKEKNISNNDELLEILDVGVFFCNINGDIIRFNNKFLEIIGSTVEKIGELNIFNDLKNVDVVNAIKKSLISGYGEYRGFYKPVTGKNDIYAKGVFKGIRDESNNIIGTVCTIEDITESYNYITNISNIESNGVLIEKNYKTAFLSSPIPIIIHQDGIIKLANDAALEFGNVKKINDVIGESALNFVHEGSLDEAVKNIKHILSGGESEAKNYKYQTFDGVPRDVISKSGLFFIDNKPAVLVSFIDITKYKENENRLNVIFKGIETSPTSVIITCVEGLIEYVNPKFVDISGYSTDEVMGKTPRILNSGFHPDEFYEKIWAELTSGKSWKGEICNKNKKGGIFWEYAIITPIINEAGKITNYIAIKEDITRRKEIENKLVKNERYFKTLFETAPDGIFEIDKDGIIVNCNREFANSVKVIKSDIIGKSASYFIENEGEFDILFNKLKESRTVESEIVQKNYDGTTTVVWRKVSAIYDKDDIFFGAIIYNRDISRIKETEQLLIDAKDKAEEADKLKSAFLSNMSHEIRTPLNAIVGFSKLISKEGLKSDEKNKFINYLNLNSKLLLNLINDIIDISKIEANQLSINSQNFVINDLFNELYHIYISEINELKKDIKLELNIPVDFLTIKSDELRLKQILINLLSNAIKFTKNGVISFGFFVENENIILFVKDTGIGIPRNKLDSVFNRFVRVHNAEYKQKGTGLGLTIVKSLLDLLNGKIVVESEFGFGTEFKITLPNIIADNVNDNSDPITEKNTETIDWSNKTLLIAEDDEFNFIVLNELLKEFRINIIYAENGEEAIKLYKENINLIDIVLMDIQMPKIDGYTATKEILKINKNAKIIAQTAFAMAEEKLDSLNAGCIDFITKPIDIHVLKLLLSNYL